MFLSPTFIVIGPGRSGSTLLYEVLKKHPEVEMARPIKETNFFNNNYQKGLEWYLSFFKSSRATEAIGEISNTYIYHQEVPQRIVKHFPKMKIITVLRNPFERIMSVYRFKQRTGELTHTVSFEQALATDSTLIQNNRYATLLKAYLQVFPRNQLLILFYDDLLQKPKTFFERMFEFIGVDKTFYPRQIVKNKINPTATVRVKFLSKLIRRGADWLRKKERFLWLSTLKGSPIVNVLLYKSSKNVSIDPYTLSDLRAILIPEIQMIEKWTGRNLRTWYGHH